MQLRPRHFVLIAIVLGIFAFNLYRHRRAPLPAGGAAPIIATTHPAPAQTPAWLAFDHAASLRDLPSDQFDPALQAFQQQLEPTHDATLPDLKGCLTWLQFYRQGVIHPSPSAHPDTQWKDRSQRHINGCVKYHLDTTAD